MGAGAVVKLHERVPLGGGMAASLLWAQEEQEEAGEELGRWADAWQRQATEEAASTASALADRLVGRWTGDLALVAPDQAAARALAADDAIAGVAFTGSVGGGRAIAEAAGAKPAVLELGGKDALIVCPLGSPPPPGRLDAIAAHLVDACLTDGGQVCTSAERVIVAAEDYEAIVGATRRAIAARPPGFPLTSAEGAARVDRQVDEAIAGGAVLEYVEERPIAGGVYVSPTRMLGRVPRRSALWVDETFGPIIALSTYDSLDDAVAQADDSNGYALGATVLSGARGRAEAVEVARRLTAASMVGVDVDCAPDPVAAPFFGAGRSGVGAHSGPSGLFYFARRRVITVADDEAEHGDIAR